MRTLFDDRLDLSVHHAVEPAPLVEAEDKGSNIRGTDGDDYLRDTSADDTVRGLAGDDTIYGSDGSDQLFGGNGGDSIEDDGNGSDSLWGDAGNDRLGVDRSYSEESDATEHVSLDGGDGDDQLYLNGRSYYTDDYAMMATLSGGAGADAFVIDSVDQATINAGSGADTIYAGLGMDLTISLGGGADVVNLKPSDGGSALVFTDFATGDDGDQLQIRELLSDMIPGWQQGNPFGDGHMRLVQDGDDTQLQLDADGGGDSWTTMAVFKGVTASDLTAFNLDGFPGDGSEPVGETITGGDSYDDLVGTNGGDTIYGLGGDDYIDGGAGNDLMDGGGDDDYLRGGFGKDTLIGGAGDDSLSASVGDVAFGGKGEDYLTANYDDYSNGVIKLDGGVDNDTIEVSGYVGDNKVTAVVSGGDGDDAISISGGAIANVDAGGGDDRIWLENVASQVKLKLGAGADVVELSSYQQGGPITVTISDFQGGAGGDSLDLAQFMASRFQGWDHSTNPFAAGYMRLLVEDGDTLIQVSEQADDVWSSLFVLKDVSPSDLTADNLSGYPGDGSEPLGMLIEGTSTYDYLAGGIGPDTILGGKGGDNLAGAAGDDSLLGGTGDDQLNGGYGSDYSGGGAGADLIYDSSGGADTLVGGAGNDDLEVTRYYLQASDGLVELNGGAGNDYFYVDGVIAPLNLIGGDGDDVFDVIGAYDVTFSGGKGADDVNLSTDGGAQAVNLGAGDDELGISGQFDAVVTMGAGADEIRIDGLSAPGTVEIRDFSSGDTLDLSNLASYFGDGGDPFGDGLFRMAQHGKDAVVQMFWPYDSSRGWFDLVSMDNTDASQITAKQLNGLHPGPIWLIGGEGHDKLTASESFTHLDGGAGDDILAGASKADVLVGGAGADQLTGGSGPDVFMYVAASDSIAGDRDVITDLSSADTINLAGVDANADWWGDQAFVLVDKFDGAAGELVVRYHPDADVTSIEGDTDGDGRADFEILATGDHRDFINFVL